MEIKLGEIYIFFFKKKTKIKSFYHLTNKRNKKEKKNSRDLIIC